MLTCTNCKIEKPESEFYSKKSKKGFTSQCKICFCAYQGDVLLKRKIRAIEFKGSECIDCKLAYDQTNHYLFDFHHLNPEEKDMDWRRMRLQTWENCITELNKCVMLCANCHRHRHFRKVGQQGNAP